MTLNRHRTSQALRAPLIAGLLLVFSGTSCGSLSSTQATPFCAVMSDSVGLYAGNPVTQMGYKIGTVTRIEPRSNDVKVEFTIGENRPIPRDVKAVTRSPSILANRSLELVGNYNGGPQLIRGDCIPGSRTSTALSISRVIGSASDFMNGITPAGSTNLQDALRGIDEATKGNGADINKLLTTSSELLDNPDRTITDLGSIVKNMAELTAMLRANRVPLKQILEDIPVTTPDALKVLTGATNLVRPLGELVQIINDVELQLGPEIQLTLDTLMDSARILSPHYKGIADMLNPVARFIGGLDREPPEAVAGALAKHINNHFFHLINWRPPLFRIPAQIDGLIVCGQMNASMPGSCADVDGKPYAVDVALLQYALTEAHRR